MSVADKLYLLAEKLSFGAALRAKIDGIANRVTTADTTDVVAGYGQSDVTNVTIGPMTGHIASATEPHGLTTDQVGVYSGTVIDATIDSMLVQGNLPISRFGSLNYLPVNVSGSSEGLVDNGRSGGYPMAIEKDGTLVYLRLATDGSTRDLYYAYLDNAVQNAATMSAMGTVKNSTRKYRPPGFPVNFTVRDVYPSYLGTIAGVMANGAARWHFVATTNDTMNDNDHTLFFFDPLNFTPALTHVSKVSFFRVKKSATDDYIYAVLNAIDVNHATSDKFYVYRASLVGEGSGDTIAFTAVTGWNCSRVSGVANVVATGNYLEFYDLNYRNDAGGTCLARGTVDIVSCAMFRAYNSVIPFYDKATDKIRILMVGNSYFMTSTTGGGGDIGFGFEMNVTTKTAEPLSYAWPTTIASSAGTPLWTNKTIPGALGYRLFSGFETPGNVVTFGNVGFGLAVQQGQFQPVLSRFKITDTTKTMWDLLLTPTLPMTNDNQVMNRKFTGPIGPGMRGLTYLNDDWATVGCPGYNSVGALTDNTNSSIFANDVEDLSASYYSDTNNFTCAGAVPKAPRTRLSDNAIGFVQKDISKLVQVTKAGSPVVTKGGWFTQGWRNNVIYDFTLNATGVPVVTTRVSLSDTVMQTCANAILTAEGLSGVVSTSKLEFMPMLGLGGGSYLKPLVFHSVKTTSNVLSYFVYSATFTSTTSAGNVTITGITLQTRLGGFASGSSQYSFTTGQSKDTTTGPLVIHEFPEGYIIGGSSAVAASRIGDTVGFIFAISMSKATTTEVPIVREFTIDYNYTLAPLYFAHPASGFGLLYSDIHANADSETKCTFIPVAKTWTDVTTGYNRNRYSLATDAKVLMTAKEPGGWNFKFPEALPVIILGKSYTLPITTVNLTTIKANPANTTFYVFVELLTDGTVSYSVETVARADTLTSIYIGAVITDSTQIVSMDLEKVTKIAEYRLSNIPRGLSIPVAEGNPATAGTLQTAWYE